MMRAFFLLFVPLAVLTACHDECSTETCTDYARMLIHPFDYTWADGDYTLEVEFDDAAYSCTFTAPDDLPDETGTSWKPIDCTPKLDAYLAPLVHCDSHDSGMSSRETCAADAGGIASGGVDCGNCSPQPLPGQYYVQIATPGMPKTHRVVVTRGDETLSDPPFSPFQYGTVQPNGPECAPTCRQSGSIQAW